MFSFEIGRGKNPTNRLLIFLWYLIIAASNALRECWIAFESTVLLLVLLCLIVPDGTLLLYQTYFMMALNYVIHLFHGKTAPFLSYMFAVFCPIVAIVIMMPFANVWWSAITLLSCSLWMCPLNECLWRVVIANECKRTLAAWLSYIWRLWVNPTTRPLVFLTILVQLSTSWALHAPSRCLPRLPLVISR